MKLVSYLTALTRDKKDADAAQALHRVEEAEAKLNLEVVQLKAEVATANRRVQDLATSHPLVTFSLVDALDDLALLERKQKQLNEVAEQLFPKS